MDLHARGSDGHHRGAEGQSALPSGLRSGDGDGDLRPSDGDGDLGLGDANGLWSGDGEGGQQQQGAVTGAWMD